MLFVYLRQTFTTSISLLIRPTTINKETTLNSLRVLVNLTGSATNIKFSRFNKGKFIKYGYIIEIW